MILLNYMSLGKRDHDDENMVEEVEKWNALDQEISESTFEFSGGVKKTHYEAFHGLMVLEPIGSTRRTTFCILPKSSNQKEHFVKFKTFGNGKSSNSYNISARLAALLSQKEESEFNNDFLQPEKLETIIKKPPPVVKTVVVKKNPHKVNSERYKFGNGKIRRTSQEDRKLKDKSMNKERHAMATRSHIQQR